jgi:triacylglycerol lipase
MTPLPVLLIHGIDDTGRRFSRIKSFLAQRGVTQTFAMDIIPPDASISMEVMAGQVQDAAIDLENRTCCGKIDIVAYSMGTLAARYFLQRLGGKNRVRRFISIAGPHHGTLTAYFRRDKACCQMRPRSKFLKDLNHDQDPWGDMQVYSFWSVLDLMIVPSFTSFLPGAQNRAFVVAAHPLTVSNRWVMEAVWQTLTAP